MSRQLEIDVDYYHLPRLAQMDEAKFERRQLHWQLPAANTALVLVDVWSQHYISSHLQRGGQITRSRIVPLVQMFQQVGGTVIHAPSPDCESRYRHLLPAEAGPRRSPSPPTDWPPADFRGKRGAYKHLGRPQEPRDEQFERIIAERRVIREVEPTEGDLVVFDGDQLHNLLHHRGAHTLFYVGFATNMCVLNRDYGMRAMKARGYDVVLIRDATAAIEVADSYAELELTRAAVQDVEVVVGYSITTDDLLGAGKKS